MYSLLTIAGSVWFATATATTLDFGAIYFSESSGVYGHSSNHSSQSAAIAAALQSCAQTASDCQEATWFQNACGALAVGDGNGWGASWAATTSEAEAQAVGQCESHGNANCRVEVSFCSGGANGS